MNDKDHVLNFGEEGCSYLPLKAMSISCCNKQNSTASGSDVLQIDIP